MMVRSDQTIQMSTRTKFSASIGIFVIAVSLLLPQCNSRKEAPNSQKDKVPSARQQVRFDSLKSIIVRNKRLIIASIRLSRLNELQRMSVTNDINQAATNRLDSIARTMHHDAVDIYLNRLSDYVGGIMGPYLLRGLDLSADSTKFERISELLELQLSYDSLLSTDHSERETPGRLQKVTEILHKMNLIHQADTSLRTSVAH